MDKLLDSKEKLEEAVTALKDRDLKDRLKQEADEAKEAAEKAYQNASDAMKEAKRALGIAEKALENAVSNSNCTLKELAGLKADLAAKQVDFNRVKAEFEAKEIAKDQAEEDARQAAQDAQDAQDALDRIIASLPNDDDDGETDVSDAGEAEEDALVPAPVPTPVEVELDEPAVPLASGPVTRAQFVDYLWRHEDSPASEAPTFDDVPADHEFAPAIGWAQAASDAAAKAETDKAAAITKLNEAYSSMGQANQKIAELTRQLQALEAAAASNASRKASLERQIAAQNGILEKAQGNKINAEAELAKAKDAAEQAQAAAEQAKADAEQAKADAAKADKAAKDAEDAKKTAETALNAAKKAAEDAQKDVEESNAEKAKADKAVEEAGKKAEEANAAKEAAEDALKKVSDAAEKQAQADAAKDAYDLALKAKEEAEKAVKAALAAVAEFGIDLNDHSWDSNETLKALKANLEKLIAEAEKAADKAEEAGKAADEAQENADKAKEDADEAQRRADESLGVGDTDTETGTETGTDTDTDADTDTTGTETGTDAGTDIEIADQLVPLAGPVAIRGVLEVLYQFEGSPDGADAEGEFDRAVAWAITNDIIDEDCDTEELITGAILKDILTRYAAAFDGNVVEVADLTTLVAGDEDIVDNCDEVLSQFLGVEYTPAEEEKAA